MAILNPSYDTIQKLHQKPEYGELKVLDKLLVLGDEYEIYFQPYLNGDRPDIVLVRKGSGVLIIEVKDWKLGSYYIDNNCNWRVKHNDALIRESPIDQVHRVKDNFISLHVKGLYQKAYRNGRLSGCIKTCVVFTKHSTQEVNKFIFDNLEKTGDNERAKWRSTRAQHANPVGIDSLEGAPLRNLLERTWIARKSYYFDDDFYQCIHRHLQCPIHTAEEGINIIFSKEQKELIHSPIKRQKIKGPAGSGKTLVLAARAVNAHLEKGSKVLILTFNITLINYIKDRLADIPKTFSTAAFDIANYHNWFKGEANNYGLNPKGNLSAYNDQSYFDPVKDEIKKYDTILIDEVQDYKTHWLYLINNFFLNDGGEFVVFGDEKQNIYDIPLDENREPVVPTVPGRWNRSLKTSFRFVGNLSKIAADFQTMFYKEKYHLDDPTSLIQPELDFTNRFLQYYQIDPTCTFIDYRDIINGVVNDYHIHPGDITVLSMNIELLRGIEQVYRLEDGIKVERMHETEEEYKVLVEQYPPTHRPDQFEYELTKIRRNYKRHFYAKSGLMKFSTVHSFKGWESDSILLLLSKNRNDESEALELVYTGLTRAKRNLVVLNGFDAKYDEFFTQFESM